MAKAAAGAPHRTPPRRRAARAVLSILATLALALAAAALGSPTLRGRVVAAGRWLLDRPATLRRAALAPEPAPFSTLAASQVGYAPAMAKWFTSPAPFDGFEVVREGDGVVVLRGGPGQRVRNAALGGRGEAFLGDFTALAAPGRYHLAAAGRTSAPFDVGEAVFDAAARAVRRSFYFQRAFTAVEPAYAAGPWTHGSDAPLAPPGVAQGWHDAGDFSIYNASAVTALHWMLSAWADFGPADDDDGIPESGNGVPDLLDEARWGLTWLLSVQAPSGGFANTTCQERYGPYGTNFPERMAPYRAGEVGTIPTGRAAGVLAFAAALYRPVDAAFAARCLAAAVRGWRFLEARPGEASDGPTCPAFRQDGDARAATESRLYAAAGLLLATGAPAYRAAFEAAPPAVENDPSYLRPNVYAALLYLRATPEGGPVAEALRAGLAAMGAGVRADGADDPFEWATRRLWGSLAAGFMRTGAFSAPACLADPRGAAADCRQALANVHHLLGRNYQGMAFVSGLPGVTRGRQRAFHHWLAALRASPFLFPGLVAGGPSDQPDPRDVSSPRASPLPLWGYRGDPAMPRDEGTPPLGRYTDNDSWSTNEIDVEWQGVTLYHLELARAAARSRAGPGPPVLR